MGVPPLSTVRRHDSCGSFAAPRGSGRGTHAERSGAAKDPAAAALLMDARAPGSRPSGCRRPAGSPRHRKGLDRRLGANATRKTTTSSHTGCHRQKPDRDRWPGGGPFFHSRSPPGDGHRFLICRDRSGDPVEPGSGHTDPLFAAHLVHVASSLRRTRGVETPVHTVGRIPGSAAKDPDARRRPTCCGGGTATPLIRSATTVATPWDGMLGGSMWFSVRETSRSPA